MKIEQILEKKIENIKELIDYKIHGDLIKVSYINQDGNTEAGRVSTTELFSKESVWV